MENLQLMWMLSFQRRCIHMNMILDLSFIMMNLTIMMVFMCLRNPIIVTNKKSKIWRWYQNYMQPQRRMDRCQILLDCSKNWGGRFAQDLATQDSPFLWGCSVSSRATESAIQHSMQYWSCCPQHSLTPNYLQHMMMQISIFTNWALDTTRSMCAIITVCCSGTGMPTWMPAQNAKNPDGKIRMANVFLGKFWGISP